MRGDHYLPCIPPRSTGYDGNLQVSKQVAVCIGYPVQLLRCLQSALKMLPGLSRERVLVVRQGGGWGRGGTERYGAPCSWSEAVPREGRQTLRSRLDTRYITCAMIQQHAPYGIMVSIDWTFRACALSADTNSGGWTRGERNYWTFGPAMYSRPWPVYILNTVASR